MVQDAEKFKAEDTAAKERITAKNELENYAYSVKNTLNDSKMEGKISEEDKKTAMDKIEATISWLDTAENAEKEEFDGQKKELEGVINPIIAKLYQAAGGAPGAEGGAPGGMPGMPGGMGGMPDFGQAGNAPGPDAPKSEPIIEEVD